MIFENPSTLNFLFIAVDSVFMFTKTSIFATANFAPEIRMKNLFCSQEWLVGSLKIKVYKYVTLPCIDKMFLCRIFLPL